MDKDEAAAMGHVVKMCVYLQFFRKTSFDRLGQLALSYGFHIDGSSHVICNKTDLVSECFIELDVTIDDPSSFFRRSSLQ